MRANPNGATTAYEKGLADGRRATVERIRLRVVAIEKRDGDDWAYIAQILAILDAEAAL